MKKRFLSMLLCLCLLLTMLPTVALADNYTEYDVWVGGTRITSENAGGVQGDGISGSVIYDADNQNLILNDAHITSWSTRAQTGNTSDILAGIYSAGDLTITLRGENTVDTSAALKSNEGNRGIFSLGKLKLMEEGALVVTAGDATKTSFGMEASEILITGCHITASGKQNALQYPMGGLSCSYSMYAIRNSPTSEFSITSESNVFTGKAPYSEIKPYFTYNVWVGSTQVTSLNKDGITGEGISGAVKYDPLSNTLTLHDATLTGYKNYNLEKAYGIYASDELNINLIGTNTVSVPDIASGAQSVLDVYGIFAYNNLRISGTGNLTCSTGYALHQSTGINVSKGSVENTTIVIENTNVSVSSGGNAIEGGNASSIGISAQTLKINNSYLTVKTSAVSSEGMFGSRVAYISIGSSALAYEGGYLWRTSSDAALADSDNAQVDIARDLFNMSATKTTSKYFEIKPKTDSLNVWVGGQQYIRGFPQFIGDGISGTVTYDETSSTLTMNNATITSYSTNVDTGSDYNELYGIYSDEKELNIVLIGENKIDLVGSEIPKTYDDINGICANGIQISGTGSLTVSPGSAQGAPYNMGGTAGVGASCGIWANGDLSLQDVTVTIGGGNSLYTYGICAATFSMTNAVLNVDVVSACGYELYASDKTCYGVYCSDKIAIDSGTALISAKQGVKNYSLFCTAKEIIINGGSVTAYSVNTDQPDGPTNCAMNAAPDLTGYRFCSVTASLYGDGGYPVESYNPDDIAAYRNIKIEPAAPRYATISLPQDEGDVVVPLKGFVTTVLQGDSFSFRVAILSGYYKTSAFAVKSNGRTLTSTGSGIYMISDITSDQTITVEGVGKQSSSMGGTPGYTLNFETNSGGKLQSVTKASGTTVDLKNYVPTRDGYTFAGWYSDKDLATTVTSVRLTKNTTVYAKWTWNNPFTDLSSTTYSYDAIQWAVEKGIANGTSATTFDPDGPCTRAMAVTFLWNALGKPAYTEGTVNPFADVQEGMYYYDAVLWAVEKGITVGTTTTTFSPNVTVTRAQAMTLLWNVAGKPVAGTVNPFTDVSGDAYYRDAVLWAVEKSVTNGTTATTFSPDDTCTRGQILTFIYRYMEK